MKIFFAERSDQWLATFEDGRKQLFATEDEARNAGWKTLEPTYRLPDGSVCSDLPPGAVYAATDDYWPKGPDGRSLICVCPDGHHWYIDDRASNCTRKDDNVHRCWVRHGRPEDGTLHVDKAGDTCSAGAGSIVTPKFHGFLHHGQLVSC